MLDGLGAVMRETCEQMGGELLEFGAEDDHLHLMLSIPPAKAISNFVGKLKGKSAYYLRRHHWEDVRTKLWVSTSGRLRTASHRVAALP